MPAVAGGGIFNPGPGSGFTFETWIFVNTTPAQYTRLFSFSPTGPQGPCPDAISLYFGSGGSLVVEARNAGTANAATSSGSLIPTGQWNHVVVSVASGLPATATYYVNGQSQGSASTSASGTNANNQAFADVARCGPDALAGAACLQHRLQAHR